MKKRYFISTCFFLGFFSSWLFADEALVAREDIQTYIERITHQHPYLDRNTIYNAFLSAQYKPEIIRALDRPSTKLPWYRFAANMLSKDRITQGAIFWQNHQATLDQVYQQYGTPPEIIVAILGIETRYGQDKGKFRTIDALSTIAFYYPRRAEYFQRELEDFFILTDKLGQSPLDFKSSYAGAMGMPQFMPSSMLKYAVDFGGEGDHNLWTNAQDAIISIANYLYQFGWEKDAKMISAASVPFSFDAELANNYMNQPFASSHSITDWKKQGVIPFDIVPLEQKAVLFSLDTQYETEYWLGLNNFYVITRYNKSTNYAMAVVKLAEEIKQAYQTRH